MKHLILIIVLILVCVSCEKVKPLVEIYYPAGTKISFYSNLNPEDINIKLIPDASDYVSMCEGIENCMKMFPEKYAIKNPYYHDQSEPTITKPTEPVFKEPVNESWIDIDPKIYITADPTKNMDNNYEYISMLVDEDKGFDKLFFYIKEINCLNLSEIKAINKKYNVTLNIKCNCVSFDSGYMNMEHCDLR